MISKKDLCNSVNNSINNPTDEEIKRGEKILKKLDKKVKKVAYKGGDFVQFFFIIQPTLGTVNYVMSKLENLGYTAHEYYNDAGHYISIYLDCGKWYVNILYLASLHVLYTFSTFNSFNSDINKR